MKSEQEDQECIKKKPQKPKMAMDMVSGRKCTKRNIHYGKVNTMFYAHPGYDFNSTPEEMKNCVSQWNIICFFE